MRISNSLQFVSIAGGEKFTLSAAYYLLERTVHASISCAFFLFLWNLHRKLRASMKKKKFFILVVLFPSIAFSMSDKRSLMCSRYICASACVIGLKKSFSSLLFCFHQSRFQRQISALWCVRAISALVLALLVWAGLWRKFSISCPPCPLFSCISWKTLNYSLSGFEFLVADAAIVKIVLLGAPSEDFTCLQGDTILFIFFLDFPF